MNLDVPLLNQLSSETQMFWRNLLLCPKLWIKTHDLIKLAGATSAHDILAAAIHIWPKILTTVDETILLSTIVLESLSPPTMWITKSFEYHAIDVTRTDRSAEPVRYMDRDGCQSTDVIAALCSRVFCVLLDPSHCSQQNESLGFSLEQVACYTRLCTISAESPWQPTHTTTREW